ncbi:MAG: hypothetical protein IKK83_01180 [Clostridia bacterium]|nr:hypothetical protein [Clostridia bacterium]
MTIQFEVVIWTVINFFLLYGVLHFLLFKPVLKVMDERDAKIKQGKAIIAEREQRAAERQTAVDGYDATREKRLSARVDAGLAAVKAQCAEDVRSAEAETKMLISADKEALFAEEQALREAMAKGLPALTDSVVQRLLEKGL